MQSKNEQKIVDTLEMRGHYVLAADLRNVLADKISRRTAEIEAIKYAGKLRDQIEDLATRILEKKLGVSPEDLVDLLQDDFDKLEEKFNKILSEHLEYKSNNPEERQAEELDEDEEGNEVDEEAEKAEEEIEEQPEETEEITEEEEEEEGV